MEVRPATVGADEQRTLNAYARLGGFMYLFVIGVYIAGDTLTGSFHVQDDVLRTAANIREGETIYRASLALQLIASVSTVLLAGAFYVLLRVVDRNLALFSLLWRILEAAIGGVGIVFKFMALGLYAGTGALLATEHQQSLLTTLVSTGRASFPISVIYFAVGSITFFWLLYRSCFIPRWLASFGIGASMIAGLMGFATLILPEEASAVQFLWAPIFVAEILTGLLLMFKGADFSNLGR